MELEGSLPHSQQSTTCSCPSQINPFLCPSHFWQTQFVSFLVGLRTYQHPRYGQGCVVTAWLWCFHSIHILSKQSWGVYEFIIWKLKYPSPWKLKNDVRFLLLNEIQLPQLIIKIIKFELPLTIHCEGGIYQPCESVKFTCWD